MIRVLVLSLGLLLVDRPTHTAGVPVEPCARIGPDVKALIHGRLAHGGHVLSVVDLPDDDQKLWLARRKDLCPGLARGNFDGSGHESLVVAIVRPAQENGAYEELVFIRQLQGRYTMTRLTAPTHVVSPLVIWSVPPSSYHSPYLDSTIVTTTDSFIYEKIEASSTLYFYKGGRFRTFLLSD